MQDSAGATDEAFKKMSETVSFQLGRLKQSFTVFLQTVGEALMPELKSFIEWFNEAAAGVIGFVKTQKATDKNDCNACVQTCSWWGGVMGFWKSDQYDDYGVVCHDGCA